MTKQPTLLVMAAGMGSRYGGLKQIEPVTPQGELILDFSAYDAYRAGFRRLVFVIKPEMEADFRAIAGDRLSKQLDVAYARQRMDDLPEGFPVPEGRLKPWGTGHAVLAARSLIDGPFAVINADDFYGRNSFAFLFDFLTARAAPAAHAMVGFSLANTLTEHGFVSRGVCSVDADGFLTDVRERVRIERHGAGVAFSEDGGFVWEQLDPQAIASMNMWGFAPDFMEELSARFPGFLRSMTHPLRSEYFLPGVVGALLRERRATVRVLPTTDKWYGVTYREDRPLIEVALAARKASGEYPERLY